MGDEGTRRSGDWEKWRLGDGVRGR